MNSVKLNDARCGFCRKCFPRGDSVKQHIAHAPECRQAWDAWIAAKSVAPSAIDNPTPVSEAASDYCDNHLDAMTSISIHDADRVSFMESMGPNSQNPYRARVEDVPDEDDIMRWVERYPRAAGEILGRGECTFEKWQRNSEEADQSRWYPFASEKEWQLGRWIVKNVGQNQLEEFLKLSIVSILLSA